MPPALRSKFPLLAPALVAALLLTSCADAPVSLKYDARTALAAAREKQADIYAPEVFQRAEEAYREGIRAMEIQTGRWTPARDYGIASARFETALRRGRLSADLADARRRDLSGRTHDLLMTTQGSIENVAFMLTYLSPRTRARSDLMRAKILYDEAETYRRSGDLKRALDRAELASHQMALLSETLGRIIGRFTESDKIGLYRRWVQDTVAESAANGSYAVLVDKLRHTLTLLKSGRPLRSYRADIGLNGAQDKSFAGDKATPEGRYKIVEKRGPARTRWYKALLINYPNEQDRVQFDEMKRRGAIPTRARIGGLIEVHGEGGRYQDWTEGCVALENDDMDELFDLVSVGTPITIVGYESDDWLELRRKSEERVVVEKAQPPRSSKPRARPRKVSR